MLINFGGSVAISTVDYPGKSAIVLFLRGCPLRCPYCHNHKLWSGNNYVEIDHVKNLIRESMPFISAVVISGGEPLMQERIFEIASFAKSEGLSVGIETSGYYPEVAERLIKKNMVDKFFVDVKANPEKYEEITKNKYAFSRLERFLKIVKNNNVQFELRTTIVKGLIGTLPECDKIARWASMWLTVDNTWTIQQGIPENGNFEHFDGIRMYSREEILEIAMGIKRIVKNVKIKTVERGEETC
jgi:pyruvate formate lyase activating enzyme